MKGGSCNILYLYAASKRSGDEVTKSKKHVQFTERWIIFRCLRHYYLFMMFFIHYIEHLVIESCLPSGEWSHSFSDIHVRWRNPLVPSTEQSNGSFLT